MPLILESVGNSVVSIDIISLTVLVVFEDSVGVVLSSVSVVVSGVVSLPVNDVDAIVDSLCVVLVVFEVPVPCVVSWFVVDVGGIAVVFTSFVVDGLVNIGVVPLAEVVGLSHESM